MRVQSKLRWEKCKNSLLRALPEADGRWLVQQLELVPLKPRGTVQFNNDSMAHVYFIEEGLISVLADTGPGKSIETRMIGPEGFVGIRVALGKRKSCHRRMVQVGGKALRVEADQFALLLKENEALNQVMLEYVHDIVLQASQLSACNAHHEVRQRLARWLLMAHDRCGPHELNITHRMLSKVLGVRRATITDCMGYFEAQGALRPSTMRSRVSIADPAKLKAASCNCYRQLGYSVSGQRVAVG